METAQAQDAVPLPEGLPTVDLAQQAALEAAPEEPDLPVPEEEAPVVETQQAEDPAPVDATVRRFRYALRLTIRGVYDDNIHLRQDNKVSAFTTIIEPGLMLGFGDVIGRQENYLRFTYAPSIFLYADHSDANAIQHLLNLEGQYRISRLTLNLAQTVQILEGTNLDTITDGELVNDRVNLDVGGRTRVNIYTTRLGAAYYLTGKTFLSSGLGATISDYRTLISSEVYWGDLFLNYAYSPKLVVGLGGSAGFAEVDEPSPDQTFQQIAGRMSYELSGKTSLNASGGIEFRHFEDSGRDAYISPVFDINLNYKPFDGTHVFTRVSRRTQNSAVLAGENFTTTSLSFGARQRLVRRVSVAVTAGYENADYFSTVAGVRSSRSDNYYFIQPGVDVTITRFWTVGAYYLRRENDSSLRSFNFSANQVGVRTSLTF